MLQLTRRKDERLIIGDGPDAVIVTVLSMSRGVVRLGIEAPCEVRVDREEIRRSKDGNSNPGRRMMR